MPSKDNIGSRFTRRGVMKGLGSVGVASFIPSTSASPVGDVTILGDFESSLDGWRTNGGNSLHRVTQASQYEAVTNGEAAVEVLSNGDPSPMIENTSRVRDVDFTSFPYLFADVRVGELEDKQAILAFQFRYHYDRSATSRPPDRDFGNGTDQQQKPILAEESEVFKVPQRVNGRLSWDLSDLDEGKLSAPKRLEIVWRVADNESETGHRGRGKGPGITGSVSLDYIHVSKSVTDYSTCRIARQLTRLQGKYGSMQYRQTEVDEISERGTIRFASGAEIDMTFEVLGQDRYRYTLGEEEYELGGGWS